MWLRETINFLYNGVSASVGGPNFIMTPYYSVTSFPFCNPIVLQYRLQRQACMSTGITVYVRYCTFRGRDIDNNNLLIESWASERASERERARRKKNFRKMIGIEAS